MKKTIITVLLLVGMVFSFGCQPSEEYIKLQKDQVEYEALVNGLTDTPVKSVSIIAHPEGYAFCISYYDISDQADSSTYINEIREATINFIDKNQCKFQSLSFTFYDESDRPKYEMATKNIVHPDKFYYTQFY
ncbi:hypothetical protein LJB83_00535 [Clostridia bacterium OttesenSCG-928-F22]|nr:hypothetical protein [Clostridia bacterium OttesenSCG-928-F22]